MVSGLRKRIVKSCFRGWHLKKERLSRSCTTDRKAPEGWSMPSGPAQSPLTGQGAGLLSVLMVYTHCAARVAEGVSAVHEGFVEAVVSVLHSQGGKGFRQRSWKGANV